MSMRAKLDCIPCIIGQALRAARAALQQRDGLERIDLTYGEHTLRAILNRVSMMVPGFDLSLTPPELAHDVYRLVQKMTGIKDPYREYKRRHIEQALELYPYLKEYVSSQEDKLLTAIKVAGVGNAIDLGAVSSEVDIGKLKDELQASDWFIPPDDLKFFRELLDKVYSVMVIADNAGETVFDRVLVEQLMDMGLKVRYAVRATEIVNDATKRDAIASGIPEDIIIDTGSGYAGVVLRDCSERFRRAFSEAELIIAKGQGNLETLSNVRAPVFFLLKAKCRPVSVELGVPQGCKVFKRSPAFELSSGKSV